MATWLNTWIWIRVFIARVYTINFTCCFAIYFWTATRNTSDPKHCQRKSHHDINYYRIGYEEYTTASHRITCRFLAKWTTQYSDEETHSSSDTPQLGVTKHMHMGFAMWLLYHSISKYSKTHTLKYGFPLAQSFELSSHYMQQRKTKLAKSLP